MAKGYKLIAGTDSLDIGDGKTYHPGDTVPCTEAQARGLAGAGVTLEGIETRTAGETAAVETLAPSVARH